MSHNFEDRLTQHLEQGFSLFEDISKATEDQHEPPLWLLDYAKQYAILSSVLLSITALPPGFRPRLPH